ncbi:translocon-associated protein subunit alpha [Nematostella vectensis]|uniref:translocon-associated protein subunit alpha n=1 Tax=Nematostella vectensis TaxID=45351 RepID=UPI00138FB19F|nr:translocon-associated protein subunit alpha [Nematostella vectensis]
MFRLLDKFILLSLLVLPATLLLCGNVAYGQEDPVDEESENTQATSDDADSGPEEEDSKGEEEEATADTAAKESQKSEVEEEEEKEDALKPSPDADTVILFTKNTEQQFSAGLVSKCLVSFSNNGRNDFMVDMMEASLRYPQDYSYYIQNFTAFQYNTVVKPGHQASFEYAFRPHESFGGRPFGLSINLLYKDTDGKMYRDAVFNETVQLVESDEGMDGETFFLYLFIAAIALLLVMAAHYGLTSIKAFKKSSSKAPIEMGTQQDGDIDYEWLPKETTTEFASKNSPRRSPRNRRQKRNTGDE